MRFAICCLIACSLAPGMARKSSADLLLQNYAPNKHDRFANSSDFIGKDYDWSGVGRSDTARWGTLISPSFALTATHAPTSGDLRFYKTNNAADGFEERAVVSTTAMFGANTASDLSLVQLASPVVDATYYPIVDLPSPASYQNLEIFTFGLSNTSPVQTNMRLGRNNVDQLLPEFSSPSLGSARGDVFTFDFDEIGGLGDDESKVQGGDSGAPSFAIIGSQPAVIGIHWFRFEAGAFPGFETGSGDTFVPSFIDQLNTAMAATGSSERVTAISSVPEPSSLLFAFLILAALGGYRTRSNSV